MLCADANLSRGADICIVLQLATAASGAQQGLRGVGSTGSLWNHNQVISMATCLCESLPLLDPCLSRGMQMYERGDCRHATAPHRLIFPVAHCCCHTRFLLPLSSSPVKLCASTADGESHRAVISALDSSHRGPAPAGVSQQPVSCSGRGGLGCIPGHRGCSARADGPWHAAPHSHKRPGCCLAERCRPGLLLCCAALPHLPPHKHN